MNLNLSKMRPTGKCYICGRSTKLLIHQSCGLLSEARPENRASRRKAKARQYASGAPGNYFATRYG